MQITAGFDEETRTAFEIAEKMENMGIGGRLTFTPPVEKRVWDLVERLLKDSGKAWQVRYAKTPFLSFKSVEVESVTCYRL